MVKAYFTACEQAFPAQRAQLREEIIAQARETQAREIVLPADRYQYAIVNDNLELAFSQLQSIVSAEKQRTTRFHPHITED